MYLENNINKLNYVAREIIIKKNMLKNNNNSSTKLYNFILTITASELKNKKFKFEGNDALNTVYKKDGLSKIVYELFYTKYIKTFFEENNNSTSTVIIKSDINIDEFNKATKKLIILAKKSKVVIYIKINHLLLSILKSNNIIDSINLSQLDNYNSTRILNRTIKNNNEYKGNDFKKNIVNNKKKKKVYLRRFLDTQKFKSFKQAENMHSWILHFWNDKLFTSNL
jgi:hypothetical protein